MIPPHSYGEVSASYADGAGMGRIATAANDPSVAGYRDTSPYEWGGCLAYTTLPVVSSIRCMLLRSARSFIGRSAVAPALGLTRPQISAPPIVK